jgi:hypothetical protein
VELEADRGIRMPELMKTQREAAVIFVNGNQRFLPL